MMGTVSIPKGTLADVAAVVLAGGRGRRMRDDDPRVDKRLLLLNGRPLLAHVVARVQAQVDSGVLINGPMSLRDELELDGLPLVPDQIHAGEGPLAGLLAGMVWVSGVRQRVRWLLSVPVDCPFLPDDLLARLAVPILAGRAPAACAAWGNQRHPIIGLWPVEMLPTLREAMDGGMRSMRDWARTSGAAWARWKPEGADPFLNVNTPDDLLMAQQRAAA
jgi:molybdenum cofactor guanylyltransferase